jgi:hypothetical protein
MEVTRIADLPPKLYEVAEYNPDEPDFVNAFTKIGETVPDGSGTIGYQLSAIGGARPEFRSWMRSPDSR